MKEDDEKEQSTVADPAEAPCTQADEDQNGECVPADDPCNPADEGTDTNTAEGDDAGGEGATGDAPEQGDVDSGAESGDEPRTGSDIAALVEAAERRGYLRGRDEALRGVAAESAEPEETATESTPMILGFRRRSIWDL